MDDLPELPFEKVLSYLNLEDRLRARAVSRKWYHWINCFKVKSLCFSMRQIDRIHGKQRWVSSVFAQNFINSTRFATFFDTFGQTILSSLKHLRLFNLYLTEEDLVVFTRTLNSFSQLEELDVIGFKLNQQDEFSLNLPMLTSLQLEHVNGIEKLTLGASRLRDVKILECSSDLRLEIVPGESVERLLVDWLEYTDVKNLKNLQYLSVASLPDIDSTLLSRLQQLKEFHTNDHRDVSDLFEQKQQSRRSDLKIYLCGLLLNGLHDPAINALDDSNDYLSEERLVCLAENRSRLADQIHFYRFLEYSAIEGVPFGLDVDLLKRFTDLNEVIVGILKRCIDLKKIIVNCPVEDIERFLNILKNCENIVEVVLKFYDQPQDLFDRLPEHCAVQKLTLDCQPSDQTFLFQLKHLIYLKIDWSIDSKAVRRAFQELPALSYFWFRYGQRSFSIRISQSKKFQVSVGNKTASDLNAAIKSIFKNQ